MSDFATVFEQFEYAIDVLREYSADLKKMDNTTESIFTLGKVSAAMEELQIHYQCLSDILFEEASESNKIPLSIDYKESNATE